MGSSRRALAIFGLIAISGLLAVGCGRRDDGVEDRRGNMLGNPTFDRGESGTIRSWAFNQHTGEPSYRFDVVGDVLVIERVGKERWGQAIQTLPADDLVGKTLAFSADISGALGDQSGAPSSPTGVGVRISGMRPGVPAALGPAIMETLSGAPLIGVGNHDWTSQRVIFEVPQSATEIQLSLRLTLDGIVRIRNPRLVEVTP